MYSGLDKFGLGAIRVWVKYARAYFDFIGYG